MLEQEEDAKPTKYARNRAAQTCQSMEKDKCQGYQCIRTALNTLLLLVPAGSTGCSRRYHLLLLQ